jgi:hypothetical protein
MGLITPQNGLFQGLRTGAPPIIIRGGVYCDEAKALFSRMTVNPPVSLMKLINAAINSYKESRIWYKRDYIQHLNLHTQQASLLNWKGNIYNSINTNSVQWDAFLGFITATTGKYLLVNGYYEITSPLISLNNVSSSWKLSTYTASGGSRGQGCNQSWGTATAVWFGDNQVACQCAFMGAGSPTLGEGLINVGRTLSTAFRVRINGALQGVKTKNSVSVPNAAETALILSGLSSILNSRLCYMAKGSYLTDEEALIEKNIVTTFDNGVAAL